MFNLTIVTACWNASNLQKVIKSIDNQTFKDWQHIMVNDAHPDVRDVFKDLCDSDKRHPKRHWVDLGVRTHYYGGLARNVGAMIAFSYIHHSKRDIENEWVVFHDDDNKWYPNHLQSMIDTAEANPEARMIASDMEMVGRTDKEFKARKKCALKHGGCDLGQFMYKTSLFRDYGYFFPHPRRKHKFDWELISKISKGEEDKIAYTKLATFIMTNKKI